MLTFVAARIRHVWRSGRALQRSSSHLHPQVGRGRERGWTLLHHFPGRRPAHLALSRQGLVRLDPRKQ